jgi:hypothetical protein
MHALEITNYLDERISELAKNRLPEEPVYPSGDSQYASFMMPLDETNMNGKATDKWSTHSTYTQSNGNLSNEHKLKYDSSPKNRYTRSLFINIDSGVAMIHLKTIS